MTNNLVKNLFKYAKLVLIILAMSAALFSISGCTDINGDLSTKAEVKEQVALMVPSEKYKLVSVEHDTVSRPKIDTYTYVSTERDLTFTVISTLYPIGIDASTIGYGKRIDVRYAQAVHELYMDDLEKIFADMDGSIEKAYYYDSYEELEEIAKRLTKADELYRKEEKYNTKEWLKENYLKQLRFSYRWNDSENNEKSETVFSINIDGTIEYDEIYEYITYMHAKAAKAGHIADENVPDEVMIRVHELSLDAIMLNGENLTKKAYEKDRKLNRTNSLESYYFAHYYYPWDTYIIVLDVGITGDDYAPQWLRIFFDAADIPYTIKDNKGKVSFSTKEGDWEITAKKSDDGYISSAVFKLNGKEMDIKYLSCKDKMTPVNATYLIGISIEDFADIFGLDYEINEEGKCLKLWLR